ncbi:hypothetical protein AAA806_002016 [Vibrio cholerae]
MSKSEFVREDRYLVLKRSDIETGLSEGQKDILLAIADIVGFERRRLGKTPLECVVVESDWPNYEETWSQIKSVVYGEFKSFADKEIDLVSKYGDNWYDGFMCAKGLSQIGEDIDSYSVDQVLRLSEKAESDWLESRR